MALLVIDTSPVTFVSTKPSSVAPPAESVMMLLSMVKPLMHAPEQTSVTGNTPIAGVPTLLVPLFWIFIRVRLTAPTLFSRMPCPVEL